MSHNKLNTIYVNNFYPTTIYFIVQSDFMRRLRLSYTMTVKHVDAEIEASTIKHLFHENLYLCYILKIKMSSKSLSNFTELLTCSS